MKIAILTLPIYSNYGGLLQAYALQQVLRNWGHEPVTIDYRIGAELGYDYNHPPLRERLRRLGSTLKRLTLRHLLRRKVRVFYSLSGKDISQRSFVNFNRFMGERLTFSPEIRSFESLRQWTRQQRPDLWIVGSDQVWREQYSPNIRDFFLDFLPRADTTPAISYAASFGVAHGYISPENMPLCRQLLTTRFKAVTVREREAVDIVRRDFGRQDVRQVLDPTLLLTADHYRSLISLADFPQRPTVTAYILDTNSDKEAVLQRVSSRLGADVRRISAYPDAENSQPEVMPSVSYWLASIAGAEFVITDSFHGMVFSIIFNRPFAVIPNFSRGLDRFLSILEPLGLTDRIVTDPILFTPGESLFQPTDASARLDSLRADCLSLLKNLISEQ